MKLNNVSTSAIRLERAMNRHKEFGLSDVGLRKICVKRHSHSSGARRAGATIRQGQTRASNGLASGSNVKVLSERKDSNASAEACTESLQ